MKTNQIKKDVKNSKQTPATVAPLVMNTEGGEMPQARRGQNSELLNAKAVFSKAENEIKPGKKH